MAGHEFRSKSTTLPSRVLSQTPQVCISTVTRSVSSPPAATIPSRPNPTSEYSHLPAVDQHQSPDESVSNISLFLFPNHPDVFLNVATPSTNPSSPFQSRPPSRMWGVMSPRSEISISGTTLVGEDSYESLQDAQEDQHQQVYMFADIAEELGEDAHLVLSSIVRQAGSTNGVRRGVAVFNRTVGHPVFPPSLSDLREYIIDIGSSSRWTGNPLSNQNSNFEMNDWDLSTLRDTIGDPNLPVTEYLRLNRDVISQFQRYSCTYSSLSEMFERPSRVETVQNSTDIRCHETLQVTDSVYRWLDMSDSSIRQSLSDFSYNTSILVPPEVCQFGHFILR